jgi:hypothetical protein
VYETDVYLQNVRLIYVISIPLVNKGEFTAYYLVPAPFLHDKDKLIYIKTGDSVLYVDNVQNTITWVLMTYYINAKNPLKTNMFAGRKNRFYPV